MAGDSFIPKLSLRQIAGWAAALVTMLAITWLFWPKVVVTPYQLAPVQLGDVGETRAALKVPVAALAFSPYDPHTRPTGVSTNSTVTRQGTQATTHNASLLQSLNLTPEQRRRIEPVLDQARADAEGHYGAATGEARRKILRDAMRVAFDRISPWLNDDQKTRLERAYVQIGSAGTGAARGLVYLLVNNKPVPVPVRVGATDGVYSVVQSYDLKPGDQVIIAGGPRPRP